MSSEYFLRKCKNIINKTDNKTISFDDFSNKNEGQLKFLPILNPLTFKEPK